MMVTMSHAARGGKRPRIRCAHRGHSLLALSWPVTGFGLGISLAFEERFTRDPWPVLTHDLRSLAELRLMTAPSESEQQPDAQSSVQAVGTDTGKENSVRQILSVSLNLFVTFSAIIAVVALVFAWTKLGASDLVKVFATVGLAALVVSLASVRWLKNAKQLSPAIGIAAASVSIACICVTSVIVLHFWKPQYQQSANDISESAARRAATVRFVQRGTVANSIIVACQKNVPVSGHLPKGYKFAVGNAVTNGSVGPEFVPETAEGVRHKGDTWQIPVTFGQNSDAGDKFIVYLEVMPAQELEYLVNEGRQVRYIEALKVPPGTARSNAQHEALEESWWVAPALPPPPAFKVDTQVYQRSSASNGCPD